MAKKGNKNNKGCGCFVAFVVMFFGLPTAFSGVVAAIDYFAEAEERAFKEQWPAFFDPFDRAAHHLDTGAYLDALSAAEQALAAALATPELHTDYLARAYARKAEAHIGLWHYVDAEATLLQALAHADEALQADLNRILAEVRGIITDNDTERNEQHIYHAAPGIGPARTLHGKVVVAYVFIDDGKHSTWSLKAEKTVLQHLELVKRWLQAQAQEYGTGGLTFTERIFHYDKDPWLRNALLSLHVQDAAFGYDLAGRVAALQNAPSVNAFLYRLIREEAADQAILLMHVNIAGKRSFAHVCWTACPEQAEYAFILKPARPHHWEATAYTQAHEALHLFGADDLYNLKGGRQYAPRDIMHNYARYIEASVIDSITAFGVGWLRRSPTPLPFPLQQADAAP